MDVVADAKLTAAVSAAGGFGILGGGYGDAAVARAGARFARRGPTRASASASSRGAWRSSRSCSTSRWSGSPRRSCFPSATRNRSSSGSSARAPSLICQVQSLALAKEAVAAGADVLVAQGTEGGGHGASRGLVTLVPEVVDAVGTKVPVVAAGGIADGRGLAAALMLGASGVLLGTRFYATQEAAGAQAAKERIRAATGDDTLRSIVFDISRRNVWPAPFTGRCLRNAHTERWFGREVELLRHQEEEAARYAAARDDGNFDVAAVIAGESSGLVREITSAREVVERTVREASALLAGGARR